MAKRSIIIETGSDSQQHKGSNKSIAKANVESDLEGMEIRHQSEVLHLSCSGSFYKNVIMFNIFPFEERTVLGYAQVHHQGNNKRATSCAL